MNGLSLLRHPVATVRLPWFVRPLRGKAVDFGFYVVLQVLRLLTILNKNYREKHIANFQCSFSFVSRDSKLDGTAVFSDGSMSVKKHADPSADVRVVAETAKGFFAFLLSENPDIFRAIVHGLVSYEGNFNCLLKFIYMARDARTRLTLAG